METNTLIIIILLIIILFALIIPFISKNQQLTTQLRSPISFSTSDPNNNSNNNSNAQYMPTTKATIRQRHIVQENYEPESFKNELSTLDVIDKERKLLPKDSNILNTPMHNKDLHKNKEAFTNLGLFNNGPDGFSF